jgi:alkylresorcinol/alkylpyrone synthase
VSGLAVARDLAAARPGSKVLLVVVEACSLSFRDDRLQKADVIATVLFGDGAAAACLSTDAHADELRLGRGHQHLWPDTLGIMGWDVDETGFGVVFDRSIPSFVAEHLRPAAEGALAAAGLSLGEVDRFVCHPGGAKVVDAIEGALSIPQGDLAVERDVLRRAGNMSAPTVLFVLQDVLAAGQGGRMMAAALGPGFTASFLPMARGVDLPAELPAAA